MKTLKISHEFAGAVLEGKAHTTWRIADDKNLAVNDQIELIDKVDPRRPDTWRVIGVATIDHITEQRLSDLSNEALNKIAAESHQALYTLSRQYYGSGITEETPVKLVHFSFQAYDQPQEPAEVPEVIEHIKLYADGGSRGNPGPSASGYVLLTLNDEIIVKSGVYLGITTNNQAEYQALKFGLETAQKRGALEVDVYMDSLLVVNQMKGIFKVRNRDLWPIHEAIKEQVKLFKKVTFTHVPRELNKLADGEVNETLDAELKN
jgi:ribonuclease HI